MPLSTSSSEPLPSPRWQHILPAALLILLGFIGFIEYQLARKGFEPTVLDTAELWQQQRQRASQLGKQALIIVGSSRSQLGLDLAVLRQQTGLEPVQLALDGSSFLPILQGLAEDPEITGTILVDYMDHLLAEPRAPDRADEYQQAYLLRPSPLVITSATTEAWLSQQRQQLLRSYADGARPITSLLTRLLVAKPAHQYLNTLPDRSRKADYQRVSMPDFYYQRVLRNLGNPSLNLPANATFQDLDTELQQRIAALSPADTALFTEKTQQLSQWVDQIQQRGGRVVFIVMPSSGLVRRIEQQRYPRSQFWEVFHQHTQAQHWHFEDNPQTRGLQCPDGSHLDQRQRTFFTQNLSQDLALKGSMPNP